MVSTGSGRLLAADTTTDGRALDLMTADSTWMTLAACGEHPPNVFFPVDGVGVEIARKICATCPVQEPCLEYAVVNRIEHGVWGGTSERGRRRLYRARQLAAAAVGSGG